MASREFPTVEVEDFVLEFFRYSDLQYCNYEWIRSFSSNQPVLQMFDQSVHGIMNIAAFREQMWADFDVCRHDIEQIFPSMCVGDPEELTEYNMVLLGSVFTSVTEAFPRPERRYFIAYMHMKKERAHRSSRLEWKIKRLEIIERRF